MAATVYSLPYEVLEKIFAYLPFKDVRRAALVNHTWNEVLHGPKFQRRFRVVLQDYFRQELSIAKKSFIQKCKHLSIVQQFDAATDTPPENGVLASIDKGMHAEQNIANILRGTTELHSLQLFSRYKSIKDFIQERLPALSHLKEFKVSFCYNNEVCENEEDDLALQLKSDSLESFKIGLPYSVGLVHLEAPNLKELHMTISCNTFLSMIQKYSNQLETLKVRLLDIETLDKFMTFRFPRLIHLELGMYDDKELQHTYSQTANRVEDDDRAKKFIQPSLKVLSVHSHVVFYKMFPILCSVRSNIEEIELHNMEVDANVLINILLTQPLKSLIVQQCEIINDLPGLHIRMVGLQHLRLISVVNNVLLEHNFCGLKSLELSHGFKFGNDLLQKVFHNFAAVENLKIHFRTKLDEDAFQKLHLLKYLKSLILKATETTAEHWSTCEPLPSIEQLTISSCFMLRFSMFAELGRVFPFLKRLNIDRCHVIDDTKGSDATVETSCEEKIRRMFTNSIVSWHDSVQITPITLKQLLM